MDDFSQILFETRFTTKESVERIKNRYSKEELEQMANSQKVEVARLREKYANIRLPDEELIKQELTEYMTTIIKLINSNYSELIPSDRLKKLNNMIQLGGVAVINDVNDNHDFSADSKNGKVIVNLARIGKTEKNPNPDIYTQMLAANGTLPHELFHIIIQMLMPEEVANERMVINMSNGEVITSRGMVGFMLNEGFVEKFSIDFCQRHGLYHQIAPQYISYVDICNYIMDRYPQINEQTIFSLDERDVIGALSPIERQKYYQAEAVSYAVRHKKKNANDVVNSSIEKVEIEYSDVSKERLEEIKMYYVLKNSKLAETSAITPENKHL